jgi:hypothetical protein
MPNVRHARIDRVPPPVAAKAGKPAQSAMALWTSIAPLDA